MSQAICNSACLIAFDRIDRLNLLADLFTSTVIPEGVVEETGLGRPWMDFRSAPEGPLLRLLLTQVHRGEAEAISIAASEPASEVILDDLKARKIAISLGLPVIGTVGLLVRAKDRGLLTLVKPLLIELEEAEFRVSKELVQRALRLAGES